MRLVVVVLTVEGVILGATLAPDFTFALDFPIPVCLAGFLAMPPLLDLGLHAARLPTAGALW